MDEPVCSDRTTGIGRSQKMLACSFMDLIESLPAVSEHTVFGGERRPEMATRIFPSVLFLFIVTIATLVPKRALANSDDGGSYPTAPPKPFSFNAQQFHPPLFGGDFASIEDSGTLGNGGVHAAGVFNYSYGPLVSYSGARADHHYIEHLQTIDLIAAFSTWNWLLFGFDFPIGIATGYNDRRVVTRAERGDQPSERQTVQAVGDLRLGAKIVALRQEKAWIGWAILLNVNLPLDDNAGDFFLSERRNVVSFGGAIEHDFGPLNIAITGLYLWRKTGKVLGTNVGDAYRWGGGISHDFDNGLGLTVEYTGTYYETDDPGIFPNIPQEALITVRRAFGASGARVFGGVGAGLDRAYGAPICRFVLGLEYATPE